MSTVPWLTAVLCFLAILAIILIIWCIKEFSTPTGRFPLAPRRSQLPLYSNTYTPPRYSPQSRDSFPISFFPQNSLQVPQRALAVPSRTSHTEEMRMQEWRDVHRISNFMGTSNIPIIPMPRSL